MGSTEYDFEGDAVVVTGGAAGIGRAIALAFAEAGAAVIVGDVRKSPKTTGDGRSTVDLISDCDGQGTFVTTDVSDPSAVSDLVSAAREYGGVDVMVNNAAVYSDASLSDLDPAELERVQAVNESGVVFGCQEAALDMLDRDDPGSIVNVASISSELAQANQIAYAASKGAVKMITRTTAFELAEDGIRVNAVAPGHVATEIIQGRTETLRNAGTNDFFKPVPLGRGGEPVEIADAVLFLASDAASYITGELLFVDGGWNSI